MPFHLSVDVIIVFFVLVLVYYLLLYLTSLFSPKYSLKNLSGWALVIIIPAHNEEQVIQGTIKHALSLLGSVRVIVIDDGSTDSTAQIVQNLKDPRLNLLIRRPPNAVQGKGEALNYAYNWLASHYHNWFPSTPDEKILITVVDADGYLDRKLLIHIAAMLNHHQNMGGVQVPVSILNAETSLLLRCQDLEFIGFSFFVQKARHWFSSVGLGGNGQFIRLSVLKTLAPKPWSKALSEDLDIGLRLLIKGHRLGFCDKGFVHQQGLRQIKPLLKQRTRWIHGHYQAWRNIPAIWRSKNKFWTKVDVTIYLLLVVSVWIVVANALVSVLTLAGVVKPHSVIINYLTGLSPIGTRTLLVILSFGPLLFFAITYIRHSPKKVKLTHWPIMVVIFSLYGWIWAYASFATVWRILRRKNNWVKTERYKYSHSLAENTNRLN